MEKTRLSYLDLSKGLGILMITYGHITDLSNPVDSWMSMFKITIFYIVSGYLLAMSNHAARLSYKQYANKLFRSIMIPYFAFSFLGLIFRIAMLYLRRGDIMDFAKTYVYQTLTLRGYSTLWFLPTLFFGSLLLFWVVKHKNAFLVIASFTVPLIIGYFVSNYLTTLSDTMSKTRFLLISCPVLTVSKSIVAFWFVAVGYVSYRFLLLLKGQYLRLAVGIFLSLLTIYLSTVTGSIDFNNMSFGTIPALFYIGGISGSIGSILVFEYLSKFFTFPILTYFGKNSLILMSIQRIFYLINIADAGWGTVSKMPNYMGLRFHFDCLAILAIVLLIAYPVTEYINQKLPFLIGKKKALN